MEFTHFNEEGRAHMVEVGEKDDTKRIAVAKGRITMKKETVKKIRDGLIDKGDVLSVAQVGGIMGAKKTSDLIPMCHNINLTGADIRFNIGEDFVEVEAETKTVGKTGVEMEALMAVSITCLTIYDMCKAIDREMTIGDVKLMKKTGGKSGTFQRKKAAGKVLSVNISDRKGIVKEPLEEGLFIEEFGLDKDAHSGKWHRQVSLLGIESFEKMYYEGIENLHPGSFAENITTEGLVLYELPVGTKLVIGDTIQEVTQIGKECHVGCAISQKVGKCVMPKEGIFTKVIKGGIIRKGDLIEII